MDAIAVEKYEGIPLVTPQEWIDITNSDALRKQLLDELEAGARALILDLADVRYIDSSGLAALVAVSNGFSTAGATLVLCALEESVQRVFELTKLDDFFTTVSDRDAAVEALAGKT